MVVTDSFLALGCDIVFEVHLVHVMLQTWKEPQKKGNEIIPHPTWTLKMIRARKTHQLSFLF
jgi:hypothetical protein